MATGDLVGAARHYAAARRQAPYTPRGDLWAGVQRAWIARLVSGVLDPAQEAELRQVLDRSELVAQAPGLDPYFVDLVAGTCHHFLGQPAPALERLSRAFGDPSTRRRFAYSLFPALAEELLRAGRSEEARADAARLSEETANPYFRQLVETLAQGGSVVAPVAAAAGRQAGGTDR
jgi:hypothetical protein